MFHLRWTVHWKGKGSAAIITVICQMDGALKKKRLDWIQNDTWTQASLSSAAEQWSCACDQGSGESQRLTNLHCVLCASANASYQRVRDTLCTLHNISERDQGGHWSFIWINVKKWAHLILHISILQNGWTLECSRLTDSERLRCNARGHKHADLVLAQRKSAAPDQTSTWFLLISES